jgi:hypothetical protein
MLPAYHLVMRWLPLVLVSSVAAAAPGQISFKVTQGDLWDVSSKLSQASGCRVSWFGASRHKIDLDVTSASVWDVLAKLEIDHGVQTRFTFGGVSIEAPTAGSSGQRMMMAGDLKPPPTWTKHWRVAGTHAVALLPAETGGRAARLIVLNQDAATIDRVVIERATANGRTVTVTPGAISKAVPCAPAIVELGLDSAPKKLSLKGYVVLQQPKTVERKIAVPLDDSVIDIAEGRLRVHVASRDRSGRREIHLGWDNMGDNVRVTAKLVDDQGAPITTTSHGSGSSSSGLGHESWTVAANPGKLYLVITLPSGSMVTEKLPFKFDNEPIEPVTSAAP